MALFLVVLQERESRDKKHSNLEERKKERVVDWTHKTQRDDDEKEEKEEEETNNKKVEAPLKFSSSPSLQNHHF